MLGVLLLLFATLFGFLIGRYCGDRVVYFVPFEELLRRRGGGGR